MSIFEFQPDTDNKENYNPDLKTYSPQKLVNQKRYKVLKGIVMGNKTQMEQYPLKEKISSQTEKFIHQQFAIEQEKNGEPESVYSLRSLEFEDETEKKFGL